MATLAISDGTRIACERIEDSGYRNRSPMNADAPMMNSARSAFASARRLVGNVLFEHPAGIETADIVHLDTLGPAATGRQDDHPTPWRAFKRVLPEHEVSPEGV